MTETPTSPPSALKPTRILVTGAAGFIGARYVERMNKLGIPVVSVDLRSHFEERSEHAGIDFGTIVDRNELPMWIARERPELSAVIHIGACSKTTELDVDYLER